MSTQEQVEVTSRVIPLVAYIANGAAEMLSNDVKRVLIAPGTDEAHDDCCGQLHVRVHRVQPRYSGRPGVDKHCTFLGWELQLRLGVIRCAAVVDDHGNAPSAEAISADAFESIQDMHELATFLTCADFPYIEGGVTLVAWDPKGPQGGCHGGEWSFTVRLPTMGLAPQ